MLKAFFMRARARLAAFWPKGGFYVLTCVCVVAVGTGAFLARQRMLRPAPVPAPSVTPAPVLRSMDETLAEKDSPLIWPVSGRTVLTPHTPQEPAWSDTLNMYRAHAGVDIEAVRGEAVAAAMDGNVTAAYADALLGYTIEMRHADGITTRYANLSTLRLVRAGQFVSQGETIGAVGDSAAAESALPTHLHFEAYRDGVWLALRTADFSP